MIRKKSVVIWAFAAFAGMLFSVTPNVQGGDGGRLRLDGAWLVSNPEIGIRGLETITSIDPSGRRAAVSLTTLSGDATIGGLCQNADYLSAGIGELEMTSRSTADATIIAYSMRNAPIRDEIVCIWVISGPTTFTSDTQEAEVNFAIYPLWMDPDIDADGDMLPDEGVEPFACIPISFQAKRVPMMPPCE